MNRKGLNPKDLSSVKELPGSLNVSCKRKWAYIWTFVALTNGKLEHVKLLKRTKIKYLEVNHYRKQRSKQSINYCKYATNIVVFT